MPERNDAVESISSSSTLSSPRSDLFRPRSLAPWFVKHGIVASPTTRDLYDLQVDIDHECLRLARDNGSDPSATRYSDVDSVARLALKLSEPISQLGHTGTESFS